MSLNSPSNTRPQRSELIALASLLSSKPNDIPSSNSELLVKLDYHGITLLAAEQNTLPAALSPHINKLKAMMVANDALKEIELAALFDAFSKAGLSSVLFKGSALAYSVYPKSWLRPRSDSDVLIEPADRDSFDIIFQQLGYQKLFAIEGKYVSYQCTYGKALVGDSFINIDLHWHINNRQMFSNTFVVSELIESGQRLSHFGNTPLTTVVNIPSFVDSLLIASVHRLGHHVNEERLAWLYDIHLLTQQLTDLQWQQLCQRANAKQISAITLNALQTCQQILGTQLNKAAIRELKFNSVTPEPSSVFLNRELSEFHYFWADIKSMQRLGAKLEFIRESIIPSPDYVRQQMNTRWASVAYLKRFIRGLKRVFKANR